MELDRKDRKILYHLDLDARQSAAAIAKKVGLSKDAVHYRMSRLQRAGVIRHFYTVLNIPQMGFMHFSTLFRFSTINEGIKEEFIGFCRAHERVIWCVSCYGSWDFGVSFLARSIDEYQRFITTILNRFGRNIHEKAMSLILDSPTFSREYLIDGKQGKEFKYAAAEPVEIDLIDHNILSVISQHADITAVEIAHKLGLTVDIVRYRIRQLQKWNIIQGFRAALSLEQIGYLYYKLLFTLKDLTVEKERAFLQYCRTNPHITQFIRYLGNWEIQIELEVPSEKRLFEIIEGLRNTFGDIIKTYDVLKLKEEKLDYYPFNLMPAAGRSP